jgi:hypothetical protein
MISMILAVSVWCKASNEYPTTVDECKRRIMRCVALQKTEMDRQYCFYEPVEKPWPVFANEKELHR